MKVTEKSPVKYVEEPPSTQDNQNQLNKRIDH